MASRVDCDTETEILQYLKYQRELAFVGLPDRFSKRYVTQFGGLSRIALEQVNIAAPAEAWFRDEVRKRQRGH